MNGPMGAIYILPVRIDWLEKTLFYVRYEYYSVVAFQSAQVERRWLNATHCNASTILCNNYPILGIFDLVLDSHCASPSPSWHWTARVIHSPRTHRFHMAGTACNSADHGVPMWVFYPARHVQSSSPQKLVSYTLSSFLFISAQCQLILLSCKFSAFYDRTGWLIFNFSVWV